MSHVLEIPDVLYSALQAAAEACGATPLEWIAARLPTSAETEGKCDAPTEAPKTLADLFAGRVGRIHGGGSERWSEGCGEKFSDYVEAKRREGNL